MLNDIAKSFRTLGHRSKDRITGTEGVVTTVTFDLYGCIQVLLHPGLDKDGKPREQVWIDISRLEPVPVEAERVMPLPDHISGFVGEAEKVLRSPDADKVICPNCTHQFPAVPVNVQNRIAELEDGMHPPSVPRHLLDAARVPHGAGAGHTPEPLHVDHRKGAAEKPPMMDRIPNGR